MNDPYRNLSSYAIVLVSHFPCISKYEHLNNACEVDGGNAYDRWLIF